MIQGHSPVSVSDGNFTTSVKHVLPFMAGKGELKDKR